MNELFRDEHPERVRHEEGGPNHQSLAVSHRLREDLSSSEEQDDDTVLS